MHLIRRHDEYSDKTSSVSLAHFSDRSLLTEREGNYITERGVGDLPLHKKRGTGRVFAMVKGKGGKIF